MWQKNDDTEYGVNEELRKYIESNVFPEYTKNDAGHDLDHIKYVIRRSMKFAKEAGPINLDMVYTVAAYHDIGHHIDAKNHEKISADILTRDMNLKKFFSDAEIKIMTEAVYDHRSTMEGEPRSIYGKIVSSADRNIHVDSPLKRTFAYRLVHNPESSLAEICESSRQHIIRKFGEGGYAREKMYFDDPDYERFLSDVSALAQDKEEFEKRYMEVNDIGALDWQTRDVRQDWSTPK